MDEPSPPLGEAWGDLLLMLAALVLAGLLYFCGGRV